MIALVIPLRFHHGLEGGFELVDTNLRYPRRRVQRFCVGVTQTPANLERRPDLPPFTLYIYESKPADPQSGVLYVIFLVVRCTIIELGS